MLPLNFRHCNHVAFIVRIHSQHFLNQVLVYPLLYFLLLFLSVNLLSNEEDESTEVLVYYCFPVSRLIGQYMFLDLFHYIHASELNGPLKELSFTG